MKPVTSRSIAAWKPLTLVSVLATLSFPVFAQVETGQNLAPVTVSASRFESVEAPIDATVITAQQIRDSGAGSINEAIRKIAGVFGRSSQSGTSDSSLDLRGFGSSSNQNVAIFVDGIRISENELQPAVMSAIAIESVERIEVVRGGSSVLYGEGATGGTIQIITKRGRTKGTHGSFVAEIGNRGQEEIRASLNTGWDGFSIDANLGALRTDNYRANNELKQENFSGGVQWALQNGRIGFRVDAARQDLRFPGSLTLSQYLQNPRQTLKPTENGSLDSNRYTFFVDQHYGNLELAADLSYREKTSKGDFSGFLSTAESEVKQFSPRAKYVSNFGSTRNELIVGMDFSDSTRFTQSSSGGFALDDEHASQQSMAIYGRNEIKFGNMRVAAGARHEKFDQDLRAGTSYDQSFSLNAFDLNASYELTPLVSLFGKTGKSYRVANVDENAFVSKPLNPQRSNDLELGGLLGNENNKLIAKVFRHKLKDEIFFDPTSGGFGANVNLDRTKRQGIEIEGRARLSSEFFLSAVLQHVSAKFTDGPNEGKEMVLVPKNTATVRLNWKADKQTADVGVQWVDTQRYGKDFSNSCTALIPSFATLDARYAVRVGAWEFAVSGTNLTDKDYYSQAFGDCSNNRGIYPDAGRSVKLSARLDF
ncbi:TonB-dependent receptor [Herminiimonas fonticola]|uniref:Iron complex outermembrane receptor protein n=1 Tax=Herminiimonas fonticola TaxID=303380 RepID=A0A4R6G5W9_9BURK|nr:TonB-dependent receptor [Herminiimonas fonticola]RBA23866.1 TonB-dependent Receptor Plug Domain [Herminiimonas fonticola]TDN89866.1 iron complex outermembrane receptor protein [Herminiimonas fonticola]